MLINIYCQLSTLIYLFFFLNDTPTTEIYPLSLHDALPISTAPGAINAVGWILAVWITAVPAGTATGPTLQSAHQDRKSTRLNSSHGYISYAVFCLKKKKTDE